MNAEEALWEMFKRSGDPLYFTARQFLRDNREKRRQEEIKGDN